MNNKEWNNLADEYVSQVKEREPENRWPYYKGILEKALNGDSNASIEIALFWEDHHAEEKKKWLEIAAYQQNNADAYYMLGEWYFWKTCSQYEFVLKPEWQDDFSTDNPWDKSRYRKYYSKTFQLIDTAIQKGCLYWNPVITFMLKDFDLNEAIKYYEYGYFYGNPKWKMDAAWGLCFIYKDRKFPYMKNREKYYFWLAEYRKYVPCTLDDFDDIPTYHIEDLKTCNKMWEDYNRTIIANLIKDFL